MIAFNKNLCRAVFGIALSLGVHLHLHAAEKEDTKKGLPVHYFRAPQLEQDNMGEKICCVRPVYSGSLDISQQVLGDKHVITTSGFGGSGITLGEGAVNYQLEQFEMTILPTLQRNKETPITILGAGWIGSLTALKLHAKGYKNIQVIADNLERTTSFNAGGLIAPVSMQNSPEFQKLADQFGIDAYKGYCQALQGNHPFIDAENGSSVMPVPYYTRDREHSGLEPYVEAGVMQPATDVTLQILDTDVSHKLVCYGDGIFVNTPSVLKQFHTQLFDKYQIPFKAALVTEFEEIQTPVIFNCTGIRAADMGARRQNRMKYLPTLGHLIMGKNQDCPKNELGVHNSMILTYGEETSTVHGLNCTDSFYSFPKHFGPNNFVLGGTFIEGVSVNQEGKLDEKFTYPEKFELIWNVSRQFFGADNK